MLMKEYDIVVHSQLEDVALIDYGIIKGNEINEYKHNKLE